MVRTAIWVDDRERGSGVLAALEEIDEADVTVRRLSTGDYLVSEKLMVERKSLPDLARSVVDGRFFKQMGALVRYDRRACLILEGTGADLRNVSVSREAIQGALITTTVMMGIAILRSMDVRETARLLVYSGRQIDKVVSGGIYRHGYRPKGRRKRQLYILQGFPGVGPDRAQKLLETFGSIEAVISAGQEELEEVSGVGTKTAESIRGIVREEEIVYETDPCRALYLDSGGEKHRNTKANQGDWNMEII